MEGGDVARRPDHDKKTSWPELVGYLCRKTKDVIVSSLGWRLGRSRMEGEEVAQPPDHGEKSSWPELVGSWYMDAAFTIAHERPGVSVHFYDFDWTGPPPAGFDPKRVALFSDAQKLVAAIPKIG